jgi:Protein of unknown function (DUF1697)
MTSTYVVLLRAVNVGGVASLPAKDLVQLLKKLGLAEVRTYIQSGNAVFQASRKDAPRLPSRISAAISRKLGFAPEVILLRLEDLESAIASNPPPTFPRRRAGGAGSGGARQAAQGERAFRAQGKGVLPSRARRGRQVAAARAHRGSARRRGHRAQLAHRVQARANRPRAQIGSGVAARQTRALALASRNAAAASKRFRMQFLRRRA